MKPTDALLSCVNNYRGLRFQWLLTFYDNGSIDCQHRIGLGELAGEWKTTAPRLSKRAVAAEPGIFPNLPFSSGCAEIDYLLREVTLDELMKAPLAGWKPVEWFEVDPPVSVPLEVVRKFDDVDFKG